jgi:hypothetical protein
MSYKRQDGRVGLRRQFQVLVRKGMGSNPILDIVTFFFVSFVFEHVYFGVKCILFSFCNTPLSFNSRESKIGLFLVCSSDDWHQERINKKSIAHLSRRRYGSRFIYPIPTLEGPEDAAQKPRLPPTAKPSPRIAGHSATPPQKFTLATAITPNVSVKFANFRIGRANPFLALHILAPPRFFWIWTWIGCCRSCAAARKIGGMKRGISTKISTKRGEHLVQNGRRSSHGGSSFNSSSFSHSFI